MKDNTMKWDFDTAADREEETQRYSPIGLMFKHRMVMVAGGVDANMMVNLVAQLKHLEAADSKKPIVLIINSPGGSVIDGFAIYDVIREIKCPVVTIGLGMQASMGSILLASGDQRYMSPHSKLMIHQVSSGTRGQHTDIEISAAVTSALHEELKEVYVEFTGLNHEFWDIVGERDTWLSSEQALQMGFIKGITDIHANKERGPYADEAKRDVSEKNRFREMAKHAIAKMDKDEVVKALHAGQANEAEWGRFRPELVVRLSEFPEFWVEKRRQEFAANKTAAISHQAPEGGVWPFPTSGDAANDDKVAVPAKPAIEAPKKDGTGDAPKSRKKPQPKMG